MGMTYSAAIIGAGPAGCAAAIAFSRAGLKVLLIEASPFPRNRPGESLHPGIEPIFETLGVADAVNAAGFLRYSGHRVAWEAGGAEQMEQFGEDEKGAWQGYQAWRPTLDQILLKEAIAQGADIWQPCRVRKALVENGQLMGLETDHGTVRAYHFLDASGQCQWLSRQLGITRTAHSPKLMARFGYVACPPEATPFDVPLIRREVDGWSWMARVTEDRCAWSRMRLGDRIGTDQKTDNATDSSHQGWRPPELNEFEPIGMTKGADVTWRIRDRLASPGWFLLGDAAAVLDPAASHGVLRSLMSGMQAASVISACERGDISEAIAARSYSQWLRTWFNSDVDRLRDLYQRTSNGWGQHFSTKPESPTTTDKATKYTTTFQSKSSTATESTTDLQTKLFTKSLRTETLAFSF